MKPLVSDGVQPRDVWRALDHAELERQYNARATVADVQVFLQEYRHASDEARIACPWAVTASYGAHPDETLDIFAVPNRPLAPALVFVHGGYWRALGREDSVFMAPALQQQGIATISLNYSLAPGASLAEIVAQCRRALRWLHENGARYGVDTQRMVVAGSSAGAHLAAMMLAASWWDDAAPEGPGPNHGVTAEPLGTAGANRLPRPNGPYLAGAVLVSGLYDLQPLVGITPNQWLFLGEGAAEALSPVGAANRHLPRSGLPVCVAVAGQDTEEFKRQSVLYAQRSAQAGCRVQWLEVPERNHFDIVMDWTQPESALMRATLEVFDRS